MEAERDERLSVEEAIAFHRFNQGLITREEYAAVMIGWKGAIVARDDNLTGGVGRVVSEPGDDGVAWVYWGKSDHGKHESREVVTELVRLDLNDDFMKGYVRDE